MRYLLAKIAFIFALISGPNVHAFFGGEPGGEFAALVKHANITFEKLSATKSSESAAWLINTLGQHSAAILRYINLFKNEDLSKLELMQDSLINLAKNLSSLFEESARAKDVYLDNQTLRQAIRLKGIPNTGGRGAALLAILTVVKANLVRFLSGVRAGDLPGYDFDPDASLIDMPY